MVLYFAQTNDFVDHIDEDQNASDSFLDQWNILRLGTIKFSSKRRLMYANVYMEMKRVKWFKNLQLFIGITYMVLTSLIFFYPGLEGLKGFLRCRSSIPEARWHQTNVDAFFDNYKRSTEQIVFGFHADKLVGKVYSAEKYQDIEKLMKPFLPPRWSDLELLFSFPS